MIKNVLVTGKDGQLGRSLQTLIMQNPDHSLNSAFTFIGRSEVDFTNKKNIVAYFDANRFDVIINCAAYTAVDKAESEVELAEQVNHLAVKQLAQIAKQQDSVFIHISTDYVFDGTNHKPYLETDKTNPINVYGQTKLKGEAAIKASGCKGIIIRTGWVYSEFGNNFVKTMLRLGRERDVINVVCDQVGSPTYALDLAYAILEVLESETKQIAFVNSTEKSNTKTYHYSNQGVCSWFDFAKAIFEISKFRCQVNPIMSYLYKASAKRPQYSVLNTEKIQTEANTSFSYWRDSLKSCLEKLKSAE